MIQRALEVHERLLDFYGAPEWRTPLSPVDELVSTILSQNTNDRNRDKAFFALKERYPAWQAVCDAPSEELIEVIRPAGLANQKGPRIQESLRSISAQVRAGVCNETVCFFSPTQDPFDLRFLKSMPRPEARAWLMQFKGVGPKTSAIVLLFSLGVPAFPVDTHVYRVTGRIGLRPERMSVEDAHIFLEGVFPEETYAAAHLNVIRLGREICKARRADCGACPLREICNFAQKSLKLE